MSIITLWIEGDWLGPLGAGIVGLGWGFAADRIAARWPAHEDGSVRQIDWRTILVVVTGGLAFGATETRFAAAPDQLLIVGLYVVALMLLFAIDLDQRLLPNSITYPLVVFALVVFATGHGPFVRTPEDLAVAIGAAILIPLALFVLAIPFGDGAIGEGDLKLLVSVGLLAGAQKSFYGLVSGALLAGIVVAVLVVTRRISMKSFVPYGPFLIAGTLWSILALSGP